MDDQRIALTTGIVTAFVESNKVAADELPSLIASVYSALSGSAAQPGPELVAQAPKLTPAQIRKSVTPDALISFIDGKPYRMLKRHLKSHGLTVAEYKARFGLPADYPTTAPSYSAARSQMAKAAGLGQQGRVRKGSKTSA